MRRISILVKGRVQSVHFRKRTLEKATELMILGFVKNQHDGSVYIEAEGTNHHIKTFIDWCSHGPSLARVTEIIVNELQSDETFTDFRIRK